jgi:transposase
MKRRKLTQTQRRALEHQLQQTSDARVYRRTLALLEYHRGRAITEIALSLGVTRRSIHNWIAAYEQGHDPHTLGDALRSGRPLLWSAQQHALLSTLLQSTPDRWGYFAVHWTVPLLREQIERTTGQKFSEDTIRRALERQDYVWKRFRYALDPDPQKEKKTLSAASDPRFEIGNGACDRR